MPNELTLAAPARTRSNPPADTTLVISDNAGKGGNKLRLDDASIGAVVQLFPYEARDAVTWLAAYTRDKCNRSLAVLEAHCKSVGHTTTTGTFHKIFTGQYFIVASKGAQKGKFIGNVDNFLQVVEALRKQDRLAELAGKIKFSETGTWSRIRDYIDIKRAPDQVCKFGMIVGLTGTQKSACFKHYKLLNNHGLTAHLEAPHKYTMTMFITDLASHYGCSIWSNQENKLRNISEAVTREKVIIVENIQRCFNAKTANEQPIFSYLQKLQDERDCTVILSFTPDFMKTLQAEKTKGYFEQFVGRAGGLDEILILDEVAPREDVITIATDFGIAEAEVRQNISFLEKISQEFGRIRVLFTALQKAKWISDAEGRPLTIADVREVKASKKGS